MASSHSVVKGLDFFSYLSVVYGSGNLTFDLMIASGSLCAAIIVVVMMKAMGTGRHSSEQEAEVLEEVSELLNEMQVQIHELKSSMQQEFERYRGDLGFIRQELMEINAQLSMRTIDLEETHFAEGDSLQSFFQVSRSHAPVMLT